MLNPKEIANRIKEGREAAGMSVENLAAALAVQPKAIELFESGLKMPMEPTRRKLERVLRLPANFLDS